MTGHWQLYPGQVLGTLRTICFNILELSRQCLQCNLILRDYVLTGNASDVAIHYDTFRTVAIFGLGPLETKIFEMKLIFFFNKECGALALFSLCVVSWS